MKKQILLLIFLGVSLPLQGMENNNGRQVRESWGCCITKLIAALAVVNSPFIAHFYFNGGQQHLRVVFDNENRYTREMQCQQHPEYYTTVECTEGRLENVETGETLGKICSVTNIAAKSVQGIVYDSEQDRYGIALSDYTEKDAYECYVEALQDPQEFTYIGTLTKRMKCLLSKVPGAQPQPDGGALILSSKNKR